MKILNGVLGNVGHLLGGGKLGVGGEVLEGLEEARVVAGVADGGGGEDAECLRHAALVDPMLRSLHRSS